MNITKNQINCFLTSLIFGLFVFLFKTNWLFIPAGLFLAAAFTNKTASFLFNYWTKFGALLGKINSVIILTLLFWLVLCPLAFFRKLFKKANNKNTDTNYITIQHTFTKENLINPW